MSPATAGPPNTRSEKIRDELREVLGPAVTEAGYDLEDLTVKSVGRRTLVVVVVDGDAGIDLDAVATLSRTLSDLLDASTYDQLSDPFVLEVTSPGVDRPLTEPRHWRRNLGRLVQVDVSGVALLARITAVSGDGVSLERAAQKGTGRVKTQAVGWGELGVGRVQVEFNRPNSPLSETDDVDGAAVDDDLADDAGFELDDDEDDEDDEDEDDEDDEDDAEQAAEETEETDGQR